MDFDRFTIGLLILRTDAPKLSEEEENALQDAHMAHLAKLHDEGILLAAGPLLGSSDRDLRGLEIYKGPPEQVKPTADQAPGVRPGLNRPLFPQGRGPGEHSTLLTLSSLGQWPRFRLESRRG